MPRMARIVLAQYPHHIVQRGHNRQVVFAEPVDYRRYLETLKVFGKEYGVDVYAYCLMTNHVHLLLSPSDSTGIGKLMKRLAMTYAIQIADTVIPAILTREVSVFILATAHCRRAPLISVVHMEIS